MLTGKHFDFLMLENGFGWHDTLTQTLKYTHYRMGMFMHFKTQQEV